MPIRKLTIFYPNLVMEVQRPPMSVYPKMHFWIRVYDESAGSIEWRYSHWEITNCTLELEDIQDVLIPRLNAYIFEQDRRLFIREKLTNEEARNRYELRRI